jgi:hypothetical protein
MKPYSINAINSLALISLSLWAYLSSASPSPTAFIPAGFGVLLLACTPGVKSENKIVAHIAVLLTLFCIGGLVMALRGVINRESTAGIIRVSIMLTTGLASMAIFVKSFIDIRKARESQ